MRSANEETALRRHTTLWRVKTSRATHFDGHRLNRGPNRSQSREPRTTRPRADRVERALSAAGVGHDVKESLLASTQASRAIDRMRVAALDLEVRLATGHEEAAGFLEAIEAFEVKKPRSKL